MNICIIDDNKYIIETVKKMIIDCCSKLNILDPYIFNFTSPDDFINWFNHSKQTIDICFLDINLNSKIDGLEIAKLIKNKNYHILIIFMTSYDNYFPEIVQVEPFRFLSKPIEYQEFYNTFFDAYNRILLRNSEKQEPIYICKSNGITFTVNLNNVVYFSSYKRKILIHDKKNFNVEFYGKLDDVEKEIRTITKKYIRISKSYLFNKEYIDYIGKNSISVEGISYSISPKYKDNVKLLQKNEK